MNGTTLWFFGSAVAVYAAWLVGRGLGRRDTRDCVIALVVSLVLLVGWSWLVRNPATAVLVIPVTLLSRVEGVAGVPIFALVLGIAWSRSRTSRQRHAVGWAMLLGVMCFVHGGLWLLQSTPTAVLGQTLQSEHVPQTQDYSCLPAACATALNMMGYGSTEAQMAELTQTRPGSGATIFRALDGLEKRLDGEPVTPHLINADWSTLNRLPMPLLTPLQYEPMQRHMVTITRVERDRVWIIDPTTGYEAVDRGSFIEVYRGHVIVFER